MKRKQRLLPHDRALAALCAAVAKLVEDHRRQGRPLAVWRDGKAVWIPPTEAGALREEPTPYRTKSHAAKS